MSIERLDHPAICLAQGYGVDLPAQAARSRAMWLAGRQGRPPVLLVALLWARGCADVVQRLEQYLDALFADYGCTPAGWSEAQAARQVLAALNQQLFRQQQKGDRIALLDAGLLLLQGDEAQFLQAGAIGMLRYQGGSLQSLCGREGMQLGMQAELALVQHSLPLSPGQPLLLAPQPLLAVADLQAFRGACQELVAAQLETALAPLLKAPGAAVLLLPGEVAEVEAMLSPPHWPVVTHAQPGMQVDGWTLLSACPFGPPGRLFQARDQNAREALLWLAERPADDAFWQREWALRRSQVAGLPQVLSSHRPRQHAFLLFELPPAGMRSLADWRAEQGQLDRQTLLAVLEQLIAAVRALQRRGMQGLWLNPRDILIGQNLQLLLLPEYAALLPGVPRQPLPADALPLAPELRTAQAVDNQADQFALAALAYWLLSGQWPDAACRDAGPPWRYVPLAKFTAGLPQSWDGVFARALAPQANARFAALSEFQLALQQPVPHEEATTNLRSRMQPWRWLLSGVVAVHLGLGLWLSLQG